MLTGLITVGLLTGCGFVGKPQGGVYKSEDGGMEFIQKGKISEKENLKNEDILALEIDPKDSQIIYVGTAKKGILRSVDGGENWSKDINGFVNVTDIVINPNNSKELYITAEKDKVSKIFKTEDGGAHWKEPFTQNTGRVDNWTIGMDPKNSAIIYAGDSSGGIYKTEDGGRSWRTLLWAKSGIRKIVFDAQNTSRVYFRTERTGAIKTENAGRDFTELPTKGKVYNLVTHPSKEGIVFLVDANGLQKSKDKGKTFFPIKTLVKPENLNSLDLAIDPNDDNKMYFASGNAFYETFNGGKTWRPIDLKLTRLISAIRIDPQNSQVIYLGITRGESGKSGSLLFPF